MAGILFKILDGSCHIIYSFSPKLISGIPVWDMFILRRNPFLLSYALKGIMNFRSEKTPYRITSILLISYRIDDLPGL